jgi:thioredoxin 1
VFGKLNTDENPKTSAENAIQSIPTLLVYKDGELKGSIIGVNPKQEMELKFKELFGL